VLEEMTHHFTSGGISKTCQLLSALTKAEDLGCLGADLSQDRDTNKNYTKMLASSFEDNKYQP
jgi:hypothetical protein